MARRVDERWDEPREEGTGERGDVTGQVAVDGDGDAIEERSRLSSASSAHCAGVGDASVWIVNAAVSDVCADEGTATPGASFFAFGTLSVANTIF